jgi:adenosylcobyric acid synthase
LHDVALDAEDSLALDGRRPRPSGDGEPLADGLDVAVVRFPRIANFTDLDALAIEPGVSVRFVTDGPGLGQPDLVLLPGTKATVADLEWLRGRGLDRAVAGAADAGAVVLGICGGYQMLGRTIVDTVESGRGVVSGLGWLAIDTFFEPDKTTRQRRGHSMGQRVTGYEIHHGNVSRAGPDVGWVHLDDGYGVDDEGAVDLDVAQFLGTSLHGLFEADGFRAAFLTEIARRRGKTFVPAGVSFSAAREAQFDRLADCLEANVDVDRLTSLIAEGAAA